MKENCFPELSEGIYRLKKRDKEETGVLNFFAGLSKVYGLYEEIAAKFGMIRAKLKEAGKVIEDLDILFQRVEKLEILALRD